MRPRSTSSTSPAPSPYPLSQLHSPSSARTLREELVIRLQSIAPTDVLTEFRSQVANYLSSSAGDSAWYNLITGGAAGLVSVLLQAIAVIVFPITYTMF